MILAIGIVVDDAIVVVEAVEQTDGRASRAFAGRCDQTRDAEISAPIIAITLVFLSVFVPVAFISGISGELFRQFAVTVAVSMFLSAINALTLSPALCGVLLKPPHGPKRGVIGIMMRFDRLRIRDQYGVIVARLVRISIIGIVVVVRLRPWDRRAVKNDADRLSSRGRPGRFLRCRSVCLTARRLGARQTLPSKSKLFCERKMRSRI